MREFLSLENGLPSHDVTFDEDRVRNRKANGPGNLAVLRRLALNLLRTAHPKLSVRRRRKRAG